MAMKFLYPQYFKLLLLLLALSPLWLFYLWSKHKTRLSIGYSRPLRNISYSSSLKKELVRIILLNLVLTSLIFALAHPQISQEKKLAQAERMDLVFLLDTSPSMWAEDIRPSRLRRALEVIGSFAQRKLSHDRIGLVSFSAGSVILSYLTEDPNNILYYLDYLKDDTAVRLGTNLGRALKAALNVVAKEVEMDSHAALHKRVFILVSDGEDFGEELERAIDEVRSLNIRVHTIGVGSKKRVPIPIAGPTAGNGNKRKYLEDSEGNKILTRFDERTLKQIAEETGGNAYRSLTGLELENLIDEIVLEEREIKGFKKVVKHEDVYHSFLLGAFGIFLTAMLI